MSVFFVDTHTHLYDEQFDDDRNDCIQRAEEAGITRLYLPNCDSRTIAPMMAMARRWPGLCLPMMGLHPCYVKENFRDELAVVKEWLDREKFYAVGEIGLDYYWDTSFATQQQEAFSLQLEWAKAYGLPVVIHTRESLPDTIKLVAAQQDGRLNGIFHCFGGTLDEARQITALGFSLGIGGTVTFKKSTLPEVLAHIGPEHIVLETDAPYLAPVPYRGKRNESAYITVVARKIADILQCSLESIAEITTANAARIFGH